MFVTKIEAIGGRRYRISLDNYSSFVLYGGELNKYNIKEEGELSEDTYEKILDEVLTKRARLRAMNLLMKHSFTVKQLKTKLFEGGYPECIVEDAISYVASYGYIDDSLYAIDYITAHSSDKSIARIKHDLSIKGIDRDVINNSIEAIMNSSDAIDEEAQIRRLLTKRHFDYNNASYEEKQKNSAYLLGKGYSSELIRKVINSNYYDD